MENTFIISLAGMAYHINEDARDKMQIFMNSYTSIENGAEVANDVEARFAELLNERLHTPKQVVALQDVEQIIAMIGWPENVNPGDKSSTAISNNEVSTTAEAAPKHRIYRSSNRILGGVLGGLATYFHADVALVRVGYLLAVFLFSFLSSHLHGHMLYIDALQVGLVGFYVLAWIIFPRVKTPAQEAELRGISLHSEEMKAVKTEWKANQSSTVGKFFRALFRILLVLLGTVLFVISFCLIFFLISHFLTGDAISLLDTRLFTKMGMGMFSGQVLLWGQILLYFFVFFPTLLMLFLALKLIFRFKSKILNRIFIFLLILWPILLILCCTGVIPLQ